MSDVLPEEAKITNPRNNDMKEPEDVYMVEHLAARHPVAALDPEAPAIKQRLSDLRTDLTTVVTGFRWGGLSVQEAAKRLIPLLNVGSIQQWTAVLIPCLLEVDRAGNLIPAWLKVIEQGDPCDLPPGANPADTIGGRAKRFALLMLGYYKSPEISTALGELATDPSASLYATRSLLQQGTTAATHALVGALKDARGWAKVDIVEACLSLNQRRFDDILLSSGLDHADGLESYLAMPLYRSLNLEQYVRGGKDVLPRLSQQATLVFCQVLQTSMSTSAPEIATRMPPVFAGNFPGCATALFEGVRSTPSWQHVITVHQLGLFLGHWWKNISQGTVQNPHIRQAVQACLPMMPEIEQWMAGPGREVLLAALTGTEEAFMPIMQVLGELRDTRIITPVAERIESFPAFTNREQAIQLRQMCETLSHFNDPRVIHIMRQLVKRTIDVNARIARGKRRNHLEEGDSDIPASIAYAAVIHVFGQLADRNALDLIADAANDVDPYVRTQALEALKRIDHSGNDLRSQQIVHTTLEDPNDIVGHLARQLSVQYRSNVIEHKASVDSI